jgi:hypothetical protein
MIGSANIRHSQMDHKDGRIVEKTRKGVEVGSDGNTDRSSDWVKTGPVCGDSGVSNWHVMILDSRGNSRRVDDDGSGLI